MSHITGSWSAPDAPVFGGVPAAHAFLHNRGWCVAWVCSAVACVGGAALTRYPQATSLTTISSPAQDASAHDESRPAEAALSPLIAGNER
jgi:hypothetical protein